MKDEKVPMYLAQRLMGIRKVTVLRRTEKGVYVTCKFANKPVFRRSINASLQRGYFATLPEAQAYIIPILSQEITERKKLTKMLTKALEKATNFTDHEA